jgi:hypothetical protein
MTMQYLFGEIDSLEMGICFHRIWLLTQIVKQNFIGLPNEDLLDQQHAEELEGYCPRKLLTDLFISFGTVGPQWVKYYRYWTETDLEYRIFLIKYRGKMNELRKKLLTVKY